MSRQKKQKPSPQLKKAPAAGLRSVWKWIAGVTLITFLCYLPVLSDKKEFTNWDDPGYVTEQKLVKELNSENLKTLFKPSTEVMLNYHPFTMISLAIDHKLGFDKTTGKLDIAPFVRTNLVLHLLNTALVFIFLFLLSGRRIWVATISALWFGIHPMHVESVAWVSERKDVLYCFFFLLSCIAYLRYLDTKKPIVLAVCFLLFLASCLSKAMAVPLPLVLILVDILRKRKLDARAWLEKAPFLLLALLIGYNAVVIQAKGAIAEFEIFTLGQRFMFASYGYFMYIVKMFGPVGISAFYPYPNLDESGNIPGIYYLAPLLALALLAIPLLLFRKRNPDRFRELLFGLGFYSLMVALVLQFISVGQAIMADRYTYLPYIGVFFTVSVFLHDLIEKQGTRIITLAAAAGFSAFFAWQTFNTIPLWHNSGALWTNVINRYPYVIEQTGNVVMVKEKGFETAYKNRGNWYADHQQYDSAFADYDVLARAATKDAGVWSNLGNVYALKGNFQKSLEAYSKAIQFNPGNYQTYLNRGLTYSNMNMHAEALADMEKTLQLVPGMEQAHALRTRCLLNLGRYPETIEDCNRMLQQFPDNAEFWFFRGTAYINTGRLQEGVDDISKAIQLNPSNGSYHYNLAFAYLKSGNKALASQHAQKAQQAGFKVPDEFLQQLK